MKNQLVKHEMALNILEIVGLNTSQAFIGGDQGFYVTYKFPVFDVTKTKSGKCFIPLHHVMYLTMHQIHYFSIFFQLIGNLSRQNYQLMLMASGRDPSIEFIPYFYVNLIPFILFFYML